MSNHFDLNANIKHRGVSTDVSVINMVLLRGKNMHGAGDKCLYHRRYIRRLCIYISISEARRMEGAARHRRARRGVSRVCAIARRLKKQPYGEVFLFLTSLNIFIFGW